MSSHLSPALMAQYEAQLPDKKLLRVKLDEWLTVRWMDKEEAA